MKLHDLVDARACAAAYPTTFSLPSPARLDRLQPGDCVKVCHNEERFWILVADTYGEVIAGTVNNRLIDPWNRCLPAGTPVVFERQHIFDVILIHAGETTGEMR